MLSTTLTEDVGLERSLRVTGLGKEELNEEAVSSFSVPIIDMSQPDSDVADALWSAATTVGFFTLIKHGIPEKEIESMFETARSYFAQERQTKTKQSPYAAHLNAGYEYMQQIRPSTGVPDVKESLQLTCRDDAMLGRWPSKEFEAQSRKFAAKAHALARRVLALLEPRATPDLPRGTLSAAHTIWTAESQCTARLLHYPPLNFTPPDGSMRAGAHTDWTCVTLLFQLPGNEGLECAAHPRAAGLKNHGSTKTRPPSSSQQRPQHWAPPRGWVPVDPVPGGVAVNIGDMLARWSEGRLLSNLHRVRMPRPGPEASKSRYSIAFFAQADRSQRMTVRDPTTGETSTITAGDYILGRIRSNFEKSFDAADNNNSNTNRDDDTRKTQKTASSNAENATTRDEEGDDNDDLPPPPR